VSQRYHELAAILALGASDLVDGIVDQLDGVKLVDFSFGQVFRDN